MAKVEKQKNKFVALNDLDNTVVVIENVFMIRTYEKWDTMSFSSAELLEIGIEINGLKVKYWDKYINSNDYVEVAQEQRDKDFDGIKEAINGRC